MTNKYLTTYVKDRVADMAYDVENPCASGDCKYCPGSVALTKLLEEPTLFQAQLVKSHACVEGLIAVGKKSAREFWNTTDRPDWMRWLLNELCGFYGSSDAYSGTADQIRAAFPFEKVREMNASRFGVSR